MSIGDTRFFELSHKNLVSRMPTRNDARSRRDERRSVVYIYNIRTGAPSAKRRRKFGGGLAAAAFGTAAALSSSSAIIAVGGSIPGGTRAPTQRGDPSLTPGAPKQRRLRWPMVCESSRTAVDLN
eukprot:SAG31_NODE_18947_length_617_cov_0.478764_1_plen_125_part_00